jgi:hypothetical protein
MPCGFTLTEEAVECSHPDAEFITGEARSASTLGELGWLERGRARGRVGEAVGALSWRKSDRARESGRWKHLYGSASKSIARVLPYG